MTALITDITSPPILAYPKFDLPFILQIDASGVGLGCALYQEQDGKLRVIGYGSRTLVGAEKRYHSSKLEFLAMKWSVCDHFRHYLYYAPHCDIYTDNNPLVYAMSTGKLTATGQRWINELAEYRLAVHYKSGVQNTVADALSRSPLLFEDQVNEYDKEMTNQEMSAVMSGLKNQSENNEVWVAALNV